MDNIRNASPAKHSEIPPTQQPLRAEESPSKDPAIKPNGAVDHQVLINEMAELKHHGHKHHEADCCRVSDKNVTSS